MHSRRQLEAWKYLLNVVIPWMEAHPDQVDLNVCCQITNCNTYACLGGWYCVFRYSIIDETRMADTLGRDFFDDSWWNWRASHAIFGTSSAGTLEERKERIQHEIETLEASIKDTERTQEESSVL